MQMSKLSADFFAYDCPLGPELVINARGRAGGGGKRESTVRVHIRENRGK